MTEKARTEKDPMHKFFLTCNAEVAKAPLDSTPPLSEEEEDDEVAAWLMARTTRQPSGMGVEVCSSVNKS